MSTPSKNLTEDEKAARALRAKRRFKAVVRLVIANNAWLSDMENQEEEQVSDNVAKNVHMLTRKKRGLTDTLTLTEKSILRKPVIARTEEEKNILSMKLGSIKAFRTFPKEVTYELPTVMYFVYYQAGRELLREGADPINMYVILSGEVLVSKKYWDHLLKCEVTREVATLGAGSIFGEASLLYDMQRTASITTITPCELLFIGDDDFHRVLRDPLISVWNKIQEGLSRFNYFDHLSDVDIREGCMQGKIKTFREDDIIISNRPDQWRRNVYFILKGSVNLIEYMLIGTETKKGKKIYKHLDPSFATVDPTKQGKSKEVKMFMKEVDDAEKKVRKAPQCMTVKWHFMRVCSYYKMGSFNLGESMQNKLIVAGSEEVECLILPREYLDEKCDVTFRNIELYLNKSLPTPKVVFQSFLKNKAWARYKENLVNDILMEKKRTAVNLIHSIPYSIRLAEDY